MMDLLTNSSNLNRVLFSKRVLLMRKLKSHWIQRNNLKDQTQKIFHREALINKRKRFLLQNYDVFRLAFSIRLYVMKNDTESCNIKQTMHRMGKRVWR